MAKICIFWILDVFGNNNLPYCMIAHLVRACRTAANEIANLTVTGCPTISCNQMTIARSILSTDDWSTVSWRTLQMHPIVEFPLLLSTDTTLILAPNGFSYLPKSTRFCWLLFWQYVMQFYRKFKIVHKLCFHDNNLYPRLNISSLNKYIFLNYCNIPNNQKLKNSQCQTC